ncbi:acetoacetyl-CoA synthase [Pseudidiomarina aestuarii]|uniref:Acetoacetyl-CoA synthase n=1 Tax=Pseudidiomarina aestuarii TaxID=624146 RepID=A0A7Z6ZRX0_9GAMM|nr:type II toxin-antitoxin system CcdA family antitoxin [Pseudidiomarina aestuarii]RUO39122.1 acetoacetyl-CoA synthase [Pseudidiomarina aestuarii]
MSHLYSMNALKKPTNVSINSDLLEKSRALNINLSATLEQALVEKLRAEQRDQWLRENSDAMASYNKFIESNGSFSDSVRKF